MNELTKFLVDSILGESKQPILIDMAKVKFFLGKGYGAGGEKGSSIPKDGEEDENLIALLDAMAVGNLDHKAFLDQYTRFDKYFGEKGDDREGGKPRLFKLLKHELELDDEIVNTIMTDYNYKDKDMEDEEYYEQYDDMAPDEEWKGPAGATKGIKFDDSEDDSDTVEDYLTANSEWLQKQNIKESTEQITALFGGGFKPPTGGHLDVVLKGLQQAPEVNNLKILVGQGKRDGITQDQSIKIWKLYRDTNLIPVNTEIIAVKSPFEYYKNYLRENPDNKVYVFIGTREGSEDDQLDLKQRSNFTKKYSDNVIPLELSSSGGISGTKARALFKSHPDAFREMLPNLTDNDFKKVLSILDKKEPLNEGRYDTISNKISSDIFTYWKDNLTDRAITFTNTYQHEGEDIDVEATLKQTPEIEYLNVDGGADDETDYIVVSFEVNPYELPQALKDISFNLKDVIRHEIEHLTHGEGFMSKSGKYMENDEMIRKMIDMEFLPKSSYFTLEKEVDANLQGMYFRAKKERRPFRDVIDVYLDAQKITPEEKEKIINLWSKRTRALGLPSIEDEELLNEIDLKKHLNKAKSGFKKFIGALKQEGKETKEAFKLLIQSVKGEKQLSKEEKKEIGNQLKDVFKTIGYLGLFALPGGSIFSILFNLLKLNKYVLPSAFQPETINEASGDKILYAFDLDDTLITSNSKVIINHPDKETQHLTPAEYAIYEPQPGDDPDFSEFANLKDPKVIKDNFNLFSQILNKSSKLSGAKTIILTARQPEVSTDVEAFLEQNNLPQITLHAVGSSDPNEKLKVIEDYIDQGFNKIRFYDDSPKNVKSIKSISRPGVDVVSKLVKHGPLSERFLNEAIVGDKIECDKCDWSWDIKDGGDDLYVCHKCGYDNEPLNEDINSNTYPFKITNKEYDDEDDSLLNINYQFSTPNNIYRVEFNSFEYSPEAKTFDLSFGVNTGDLNQIDTFQMTGEGNARKIFKTILDIIEDFISKEDIKKIVVDGTDEKRKRIYKSIFSTSSPNISSKIVLKENKNNDPFGLIQFVNEVAEESEFDYTKHIDSLNDYMVKNKMNVSPLPKVTFIDNDEENAQDVMGKTAFYNPDKREIVLYTLLRHPKDILRSYAHEMIHHIQNLEDRLGNITTTNTTEDDNLTAIEKEAYTDGNLTFRKWTETINESLNEGKQVGVLYHVTSPQRYKQIMDQNVLKGGLVDINGKETLGISTTRNKNFKYDGNTVQIALDGDKLSNKYKIRPYDYWMRNYPVHNNPQAQDEDEEIILTSSIDNIKDYILTTNLNEITNQEIYYRGALDSKLEKGNFKGDWFSKNKEIAAQYGKTYQYNFPNLNLLNVESDKARTIEDEFEVKYPELQDEFNQDGEFLELWMFPPLELVQILFQHNYDGFKNGSDSFIINYDKISNNINEISTQEMRYWAFHSDVFSELKKWGVKKYEELKKLAKGERLQAVEHFWKKLEQGKLSEDTKDLAPQEEVHIFNENCGCEET